MREKIVAGNWKMNKLGPEVLDLVFDLINRLEEEPQPEVTVMLAPAFPFLESVAQLTVASGMKVMAQNCSDQPAGAFTGEVSAAMIASVQAHGVIVGHSERRAIFDESDDVIGRKIALALDQGLTVIYCCGETLGQRTSGRHKTVVREQMMEALEGFDPHDYERIIIAYEPVWAIGTGETATPAQAQEMHAMIRKTVAEMTDAQVAAKTSILYGGSCKPSNAAELFACADIDGGLIGGAALVAEDFFAIVKSFPGAV